MPKTSARAKIFNFFEKPTSALAKGAHLFIIFLILLSAASMVIEYGYENIFTKYEFYINLTDTIILGIFTSEYLIRFITAPKKLKFVFNFYNIIDFLAVAPMYIGLASTRGFRSLRILRLLRLSRIFRVFKIFRYSKFVGVFFSYKNTILEKILPVITIFTVMKFCVFFLETKGWWLENYNLETVFAVVGFALGIILSQKIGVAYTKFILLEDAVTKIHGFILSINSVLKEHHGNKKSTKVLVEWIKTFHDILMRKQKKTEFYKINDSLYKEIHKLIKAHHGYSELIRVYSRLNEEASFMLNRMDALTPHAYDQILHRSTIIYSILLIIFLPGISGIIATIIATYVLYGMYQVTDDMDHAMTHLEDDLITADIHDLITLNKQLS